ncbi:MAG TPA: flippase [Chloroflexia bacterium]|nr:flippase [Chloroflexia bacterium]
MADPPVAPAAATVGGARRIARNIAGPVAAQLIGRFLTTAYAAAMFRLMASPGQSNELQGYLIAALLTTYAGIITDWGLSTWLTREVAAHRTDTDALEKTRTYFGETLAARLGLAAVACLALLIVAATPALSGVFQLSASGAAALVLLGLALLPGAFSSAVTAVYNAYERMSLPAWLTVLTAFVNLMLGVGALVLGWGAPGLGAASLLTTTATAFLFYRLLRRDFFAPTLRWQTGAVRQMLVVAFPLMVNGLLMFIFFRFDSFIINHYRPQDVPIYEAAYKFINVTQILPPIVVLAFFPAMARAAIHDRAALARHYRMAVKLMLLMALPMVAGTVVLAGPLITIFTLGKPGYLPYAAWALAILICYLPFSFINGVTQYVLIALNRQGRLTWVIGAAALFNIGANLLAVPAFGIYGAAAVTVLTELVLLAPFLGWAGADLGMRVLRPGTAGIKLVLAGGALALGTAGLSAVGLGGLPAVVGGVLAYGAALGALRIFSPAEWAVVRSVVQRRRAAA